MFYDASDDVEKGNALCKTTVFAAVLFLLYAAVHIPFLLLVNERISPRSILPETGGAFFCLLTLLIGAIRYPRHPVDGETETEKSRFYARSFQRLLYSFTGLYCICTPMVSV